MKFQMQTIPGSSWGLQVRGGAIDRILTLIPPQCIDVVREKHVDVPLYQEQKWRAGTCLNALKAMECSMSFALLPGSVSMELEDGTRLENGVDYLFDPIWGAFGRVADGLIEEHTAVYVNYSYSPYRLDSIVIGTDGNLIQKIGTVNGPTPLPPELSAGETRIGNVFFDRKRRKLSDDMLFPFVENFTDSHFGEAETLCPKTLAKLRSGDDVKILAWGDSVTHCGFIKEEKKRWINVFVENLRRRFPKSRITLVNLGWPGKAINTFQCEPPGSPYNYEEQVVNSGADLVVLEFVNDAYLTMEAEFRRIYNRVRDDFKRMGFEAIVVVPHLVRPDWMGLTSQKNIPDDPRLYVRYLRNWIAENHYAAADISKRFAHLWKEGIPYNSLMLNNINHPDERGIQFYAEILTSLFPEK